MLLGGGKRISVVLDSDLFIRVFTSSAVMCAP